MPLKNLCAMLLAAAIWGTAFVAQQVGMENMGPFAFSAIRCALGGLVLLPLALFLRQKRKSSRSVEDNRRIDRITIQGGLLCGIILCVASNLQQIGIQYTTVGKAGFLTALYIVLVPLFGIFLHKPAGAKLWLSVAIAVVGLYLLCMKEDFSLALGDLLMLLCALVFSLHIHAIDYLSPRADGVLLSSLQFLVTGLLSALAMLLVEEVPAWSEISAGAFPLLYTGILSCGVAYTLQILGQRNVNPTIASLILSLESLISVLAGWLILGEVMTAREMVGCALMFLAILLAQIPALPRGGGRTTPEEALSPPAEQQ